MADSNLDIAALEQKIKLVGVIKEGMYANQDQQQGTRSAAMATFHLERSLSDDLYREVLKDPTTLAKKASEIGRALNDRAGKLIGEGKIDEGMSLSQVTKDLEYANFTGQFKEQKVPQKELPASPPKPTALPTPAQESPAPAGPGTGPGR